jgi:hypothetical protein
MTSIELTGHQTAEHRSLRFLQTTLPPFTRGRLTVLEWILRLATAGAFIGHGAYGAIMEKPGWHPFFAELGIGRATVDERSLMIWTGGFEMLLGAIALLLPIPALLLFMVAWKLGTEFIWYPLADKPAWELVERWGNYTAPLALLLVRGWPRTLRGWFR